jgi:hypothetical protein
MSSWKQYGGMNNFEKAGQIDAYSITVNKLNLKEVYQGNFDICGQLIVYGDTIINGALTVKEGMDISGDVVIGESGSLLTVNSDSIFNGSLQLNSAFNALGNIQSGQNIIADRDVLVGRAIDFSGGSFLYSTGNALGLNTLTPSAAFDISTNLVKGIVVSSSNDINENILAQNGQNKGITLGVDLSSAYMYFNYDTPIPGPPDGSIYYKPGGYLTLDVSKNVNISCPLTVSVGDNPTHLRGEVFTVYDISQGVYFGNIYQNGSAYTGLAAAFVADSSYSNVFTFMGTPGGEGLYIGGGAYPLDVTKAMGTLGLTDASGVYSPAQVIVSGDDVSHYITTTGINTYEPRVNSYVLDVNGPIHVDNGGLSSIDTDPSFELYSISVAPNNRNTVVALGSSIDVLNDIPIVPNPPRPKEKLVVSYNGGLSWGYVDVSNANIGTSVLKGNTLNNIHLYDTTNWFITGENNMIANSYDGGITWQNIFTTGFANLSNFKNVYINPTGNLGGNVFGYFSTDVSLVLFEVPINGPFTPAVNQKIVSSELSSISAIRANSRAIYLSGNAIAKFNASNSVINQTPVLQWKHSYESSYSYNDLQIFDNSYVMAVGGNIISTTRDGGVSWIDISFNLLYGGQGVNFTGVHMADISNAIAVGSQGNIWITNNKGTSWSPIPINLINPSGESQRLLNTNSRFRNVVMTDNNTILITNTLQSYNYFTNTYGKSSLFTLYAPNFINRANNMVLDISGGVRISGDMYINEGGLIGSNNTSFSLLNSGVKNIAFGGETTSIVMGSVIGNTEIRNDVVMSAVTSSRSSTTGALRVVGGVGIGGNVNVAGRMNVISDVSFNGNIIMSSNTNSANVNTGSLVIKGGVGIAGNLYVGGTFGFSNNLDLSGNLTVNEITLSSGNLYSASNIMTISSKLGLPGGTNIRIGQGSDTISINGAANFPNTSIIGNTTPSYNTTTGALVVAGGVGIGGNLNIGENINIGNNLSVGDSLNVVGNVIVEGFSNFISDASFNGKVIITDSTPSINNYSGALCITGGIGIGESVNIGANLTVNQSSTFLGVSNFVSDVSLNGNVLITSNTNSTNISSGALVIRGGVGISGNVNIGGYMNILLDSSMNGNVSITSRTSSTSSTTGALIVSGGAGIGGNVNIAGFSNFISDASFNGNVLITSNRASVNTTSGALVVTGGVGIGGNLNVNGNASIRNTTNFLGNTFVTGNAFFNNSIITNKIVATQGVFRLSSDHIGPTTYVIGRDGQNDICQILGTLTSTQSNQTVVGSSTFVVNQQPGNAVSRRAGIDIFDNSGGLAGSIIPRDGDPYREGTDKENIFAYMHVGMDLQSFVFKAPSWGSTDTSDPETQPELLSPENRVRVAVNELTLRDISNVIRRGLLILQPDLSYQTYQNNQGHYYGAYAANVDGYEDADYAVNLCSDFDISNILLKDFDTVVGTQTISTNLNIGRTLVPKNLTVFGNIISNGNIGVGTIEPLVSLDVSGSARFVGPLISTNYDTLRFSRNYGNSLINNLNQATTEDYYQDAAISYDGQFQYGLLYNRTGFGSVNVSRDYGTTWSQTTLPSNYSGNIIYQAVPYMNGNVVTFPFSSLAANISLANAIPLNIQVGTYVASASSTTIPQSVFSIFDSNNTSYWQSGSSLYTSGTGTPSGSYATTTTINAPLTISGEYFQIALPYSFCLTSFQSYAPSIIAGQSVQKMYVCGSNNNNSWFNLTPSGTPINATGNSFVGINNSQSFNSYRFIVTNVVIGFTSAAVARIDLSGVFQNVTGSFSSAMAASGTGQYVTVANTGYYDGQGNLITSSNYGASFVDSGVRDTGAVWQSVAMSQRGNVQVAVSQNRAGFGNIWLSFNSGSSWAYAGLSQRRRNGYQTVSISSTGQYITTITATSESNPLGNILISSNYGTSWSFGLTDRIYNYIEPANGFLNLGLIDFNKTVCVSSTGQYQTALGLAPSSQTRGNANIWISSNYGTTWRDTGAKAPFINGLVSVFTSITMNGSGQNQVATYITGNIITGLRSQVSGNALISSDYGNTWSTSLDYRVPSISRTGNVYYGGVTKVQSSSNGQYVFGISKYQDISASTYTNTTSSVFGVGNLYLSSVPVTSGLFSTQYFGSAHTGSVLQTHGLKLSVPNTNNAALIAGYDVNWDTGYINSADQNGINSLALNTTGGFVGIGKIAPIATLDISGNAVISGGLTIGGITNFASNVSFNTISITSTVNSTSKNTGALIVDGGAGIEGNVFTGGNLFIGSTTNSTSKNTGALIVDGGAGIEGNVFTGGNLFIGSITNSTSKTTGALTVAGGAGIGGNVFTGGNLFIGSITNSTSKTTGALIVDGGAGIGGNVNIGGFSTHAFDASFNGNIQLTQTNNPLWLISRNATSFSTLASSGDDVGIFYGTTNPAAAGLVISPRGIGSGIKMTTNGNVGIGTATPDVRLELTGSALNGTVDQARVESIFYISRGFTVGAQNSTSFGIKQGSFDSSISSRAKTVLAISGAPFAVNNYGRIPDISAIIMQINSSGDLQVGIGASNPAFTLDVTGTIRATGQITGASFNATSDHRMKKNTQPLLITRTVDLLKPVEYDLSGGSHDMGFLAHEVQEVLPFLVSGEKDGPGMQSMNYNGFIALLVKEVQDLKKENRELNERMNRLEKYFM